MTSPVAVVLDNEAVQALADPAHPKHRAVMSRLQAVAVRSSRRGTARVLTTTAVRVEAHVSRRSPVTAALGRLRVQDVELNSSRADRSVELAVAAGGSAVDATVVQAAEELAGAGHLVTVYTADLNDIGRLSGCTAQPGSVSVRRV